MCFRDACTICTMLGRYCTFDFGLTSTSTENIMLDFVHIQGCAVCQLLTGSVQTPDTNYQPFKKIQLM